MDMLLFLLAVGVTSATADTAIHYVVAQESQCYNISLLNGRSCDTLDGYIANTSEYFNTSNTCFIFLGGNHVLTGNVTFSNLYDIQLRGSDEDTLIECIQGVGIKFDHVWNLRITGLTFHGCGRVYSGVFDEPTLLQAALYFYHVTELSMQRTIVQHTEGFGTFFLCLYGNSTVADCTFQYSMGSENTPGCNAAVIFHECEPRHNDSGIILSSTKIERSNFLYGNSSNLYLASGLVVSLKCPYVEVTITNANLSGNEANYLYNGNDLPYFSGGNLAVIYYNTSKHNTVLIANSTIASGNSFLGGGMFVKYFDQEGNYFLVQDSQFVNNRAHEDGGGVYLGIVTTAAVDNSLGFRDCGFYNNSVVTMKDAGMGLTVVSEYVNDIYWRKDLVQHEYSIHLVRCVFQFNSNLPVQDGLFSSGSAALYISQHSGILLIEDCTFANNGVTAIALFRSKIRFSGNVVLEKNQGYEGGGIVLCEASYMILSHNTTLTISHNHANFTGGGIFAEARCVQIPLCFYQISTNQLQLNKTLENTKIKLINNTANFSGSQVFGGTADNCQIPAIKGDIFFRLFEFTHPKNDTSYITSDPLNVCFCDENMQHNCSISQHKFTDPVYLGQIIEVPLVTVGQYNGTVPGEVEFVPADGKWHIGLNSTAHTNNTCTKISISIFSQHVHSEVEIGVTVKNQHATYKLNSQPVSIALSIKRTPLGFNKTRRYVCITKPNIIHEGFQCNLRKNQSYIQRPAPRWLGYHNGSNGTSGFILYRHCPLDFCVLHTVEVRTTDTEFAQDMQCANSRSGILCGQCKMGYSIGLGPLTCIDCSQHSIFKTIEWSVVFLIAGLVMVVFLLLVDFTITQGMMSELLFYANTYFIYRAAILPIPAAFANYKAALELLVNIINLNYWHSHCFYNGLDLVGRTWLQFLLVIYLWMIAGAIVWLCRKLTGLSRHIGSQAVPVLATIFLLSCSPLHLSVLYSLTFASLEFPEGVHYIMLFDGNVPYFTGKHIPLFIAGCIFGAFSLGFTLILLCVQPLQRFSHLKPFRWVNKLKPLLDAYTCPHIIKPQCRFWNGFLLLVRMALYICFIVAFDYVLFMISIMCILIQSVAWAMGGVYTRKSLNVLSSLYIVNIGVLSAMTDHAESSWSSSTVDVASSVSSTVTTLTFLCTVAYCIVIRLKQKNRFRRFAMTLSRVFRRFSCRVFPRSGYQAMRSYPVKLKSVSLTNLFQDVLFLFLASMYVKEQYNC